MAARQPSELVVAADALASGQADALVEQAIPALAAMLRAHRQTQEVDGGREPSVGCGRGVAGGRGVGLDGAGHGRHPSEAA